MGLDVWESGTRLGGVGMARHGDGEDVSCGLASMVMERRRQNTRAKIVIWTKAVGMCVGLHVFTADVKAQQWVGSGLQKQRQKEQ